MSEQRTNTPRLRETLIVEGERVWEINAIVDRDLVQVELVAGPEDELGTEKLVWLEDGGDA